MSVGAISTLALAFTSRPAAHARVEPYGRTFMAVAPIVRIDDETRTPQPLGWILWDQTLTPWIAVSRESPLDLQGMLPEQCEFNATCAGRKVALFPLCGALPAAYAISPG